MRRLASALAFSVTILVVTTAESRVDWQVGSLYDISFTNFPVMSNASNVVLDLTTKQVNTNLTVTERIFQDGPNARWIDFEFKTIDGGPLASNFNANWQIDIKGVNVTTPSYGDGFYFYWSINGAPVDPIVPFSGLTNVAPIPINPMLGDAYVNEGFPPYGPCLSSPHLRSRTPTHSSVVGGMDPALVNDFHVGIRAFVPEPASFSLLGIGLLVAMATGARIRRRDRRDS